MSVPPDLNVNRYLTVLRHWLWLLVVATVIAGGLSYVVSSKMSKTYMTSLTLVVGDDTANLHPSVEDVTVSQRLAAVYAGMVTREPILTATVNALRLPTTWFELQRRVLVIRTDGSQIIEIRVTDSDPTRTKATVEELAHQLTLQSPTAENSDELDRRREFVRQQLERLQSNIQDAQARLATKQAALTTESSARGVLDLQDEIKALDLNLTSWRASYASMLATNVARSPNTLTVIQPAIVPSQPVGPNLPANVLAGSLVGLLAAAGAIALLEFFRGARLAEPDDIGRTLGLTVLGTIGKMGRAANPSDRLVISRAPESAIAEDYRRLRTNVQFAWGNDKFPITLLITSSGPEEGKSVTSANLAVAFARAGKRTILVDTDLARPSLHILFDTPNNTGLTSLFWSDVVDTRVVDGDPRSSGDLQRVLRRRLDALLVPTSVPGLRLLTAGSVAGDERTDLLTNDDAEYLLSALRDLADVIILDGPPVLAAAETATLAALPLGVLLVVESAATRADAARMTHEVLQRATARVLGVVLNKANTASPAYYQSYRRTYRRQEVTRHGRGARS